MPKKPGKNEYVPHIHPGKAPQCQAYGCREPGMYKAPRSRNQLHDYQWLCLEHIREYNKKWDFFNGMNSEEIESFMRDAVTGHRPTWNRETRSRNATQDLYDALYEFMNNGQKRIRKTSPALPAKIKKALAMLELEHPYTLKLLKSQYRALVKKHHPDVNKGNKLSEEKFKAVTESYHVLVAYFKTTSGT